MPPIPTTLDKEKGSLLPPYHDGHTSTTSPASPTPQSRSRWRTLLFGVLTALSLYTLTQCDPSQLPCFSSDDRQSPSHPLKHGKDDGGPINVILMISDGYGPSSHTLARYFHQAATNSTQTVPFASDQYLVGSHRSRSSSSLVTDSAAGATAFSCGLKTYNGAIGVDSQGQACGTIFEAAKEQGYLTGVVVTSRLTDATPACFYAHAASRELESSIAAQMLEKPHGGGEDGAERTIDLAIGGGGCYFLPKGDPASCRTDERDLVKEAVEQGWDVRIGETLMASVKSDRKGPHGEALVTFEQRNESKNVTATSDTLRNKPRLPYLSLLTGSNTPYVVDLPNQGEGKNSFPSLTELSEQALSVLTAHSASGDDFVSSSKKHKSKRRGFMLMIEGSQIDLCQHENDPGCMVREAVAFQSALAAVLQHADKLNKRGERTIVIATSDHETGGLALGRQLGSDYPDYVYYPERLLPVQGSAQMLSTKLVAFEDSLRRRRDDDNEALRAYVAKDILGSKGGLGFGSDESGGPVTSAEVDEVVSCLSESNSSSSSNTQDDQKPPIDNGDTCRKVIADVLSKRARVGWSTPGHTGVDIPIYAHGFGAEALHGNIENADIGNFVADLLKLDLDAVTKRLRK